jgi:hypothetical protein
MRPSFKNLANRAIVAVGLLGSVGFAAAADDYSTIVTAVSVGGVVTAIIAMGAVKIAPNVARWTTNKIANFF